MTLLKLHHGSAWSPSIHHKWRYGAPIKLAFHQWLKWGEIFTPKFLWSYGAGGPWKTLNQVWGPSFFLEARHTNLRSEASCHHVSPIFVKQKPSESRTPSQRHLSQKHKNKTSPENWCVEIHWIVIGHGPFFRGRIRSFFSTSSLNRRNSFLPSKLRSTQSRCVVFSLIGVALALVAYIYARLCCQEDERKHHLGPCSPEGQGRWGSEGGGIQPTTISENSPLKLRSNFPSIFFHGQTCC